MDMIDPFTVEIGIPDIPNKNARIYPSSVYDAVILASKDKPVMGLIYSEPFEWSLNLDKVSHAVENLRIEEGKLLGDIRILSTPMGKVLRTLKEADVPIYFRTRGYVDLSPPDENGNMVVYRLELISIDVVSNGA